MQNLTYFKYIFPFFLILMTFCNAKIFDDITHINTNSIEKNNKFAFIKKLLRDSAEGKISDVEYIIAGDSTRNNGYCQTIDYYKSQLSKINVNVKNNSRSGQSAHNWSFNLTSPNVKEAIENTSTNGNHTILELSLGLNDYKVNPSKEYLLEQLYKGIKEYLSKKPQAHILLVEPVPTANILRTKKYAEVYREVAQKLNLPLIMVEDQIFYGGRMKWKNCYHDSTHLNGLGMRKMVDGILEILLSKKLYKKCNVSWMDTNPDIEIWNNSYLMEGYWLNKKTGLEYKNEKWTCSKFIPIAYGESYRLKHGGNRPEIFLYDSEKKLLSKFDLSLPIKSFFINYKNAKYMRFNISNSKKWKEKNKISLKKVQHKECKPQILKKKIDE